MCYICISNKVLVWDFSERDSSTFISKTPKRSGKKMEKGQFGKQSSEGGMSAGIQNSMESSSLIRYFLKATAEEEARRHGLKSSQLGADKHAAARGQPSTSPPSPASYPGCPPSFPQPGQTSWGRAPCSEAALLSPLFLSKIYFLAHPFVIPPQADK